MLYNTEDMKTVAQTMLSSLCSGHYQDGYNYDIVLSISFALPQIRN